MEARSWSKWKNNHVLKNPKKITNKFVNIYKTKKKKKRNFQYFNFQIVEYFSLKCYFLISSYSWTLWLNSLSSCSFLAGNWGAQHWHYLCSSAGSYGTIVPRTAIMLNQTEHVAVWTFQIYLSQDSTQFRVSLSIAEDLKTVTKWYRIV